jgi:hypothetical protein
MQKMQKRHDDLLTARIEEVAHKGWSYITWWEAYLWYDQKKLAKNFWRDLKSRFEETNQKKDGLELHLYEDHGGVLLINGSGLNPISSKIGDDD